MQGFAVASDYAAGALLALQQRQYHGVGVLLLAGVFGLSGAAKVRHPALAAMALMDFRIVRRVRPVLGLALGIGEGLLALALALELALGIRLDLTAAAASVLLWFFVVLIARELRSGRRAACFCFGSSEALSWWSFARTLSFASLASALGLLAPNSVPPLQPSETALQVASACAVIGSVLLSGMLYEVIQSAGASASRNQVRA